MQIVKGHNGQKEQKELNVQKEHNGQNETNEQKELNVQKEHNGQNEPKEQNEQNKTNEQKEQLILNKLKQYLENNKGDTEMKITMYKEEDSVVFILFCDKVISYYISLVIRDRICYIDKLDSTGYVKGIGKDFVTGILSLINKEIICCFSHPQPAFIFANPHKNILNSFDLACFWLEILKTKCDLQQVWSNRFDDLKQIYPNITKGYPYKSIEDLEYFKDDPKTRIKDKLVVSNLDKLFEILLCRNDFIEGCLIYGTNKNALNEDFIELQPIIYSITSYLQGLDLSTKDKLIDESQRFLEKFNLQYIDFKYKRQVKAVKEVVKPIMLTVKRRRK